MSYTIVSEHEIYKILKEPDKHKNGCYMVILKSALPYLCVVVKDNRAIKNRWRIKKFAESWLNNFEI